MLTKPILTYSKEGIPVQGGGQPVLPGQGLQEGTRQVRPRPVLHQRAHP